MRTSRTWAAALTALVLAAVSPAAVPPAAADPDDRGGPPSQTQVDAARRDADRKAQDVAAIKAELVLANQRLEQAAVTAEHAAEAYNGARWELQQATEAMRKARTEAARARRAVAEQRDVIGALVATSYQQASDLTGLNALMSADGPEGVLDQYVAFQGASTSVEADYARFAAADSVARVFEDEAVRARAAQAEVAERARSARAEAASAAAAAQSEATRTAQQKEQLIRELARAQDISVTLAQKRQTALEEIARKRAERRARAEAAAEAQAAADAAAAAKAETERKERAGRKERAERRSSAAGPRSRQPEPEAAPRPDPPPAPRPDPQPAPAPPSGGVSQVIGFARQQVGEPYRWGAAGPDAWDCSGLTMRAWERAGVSLPHYSVAQYHAGSPVSAGQLRPGDLVFWSSSSSPDGIHHVALYIGDGMIVHAPRTGRPVTVESMYYWVPPTHFARV